MPFCIFPTFLPCTHKKGGLEESPAFKYSFLEEQEQFWNEGLSNMPIVHDLNDNVQHQLLNVKVICGISILSKMAPAVSMVSPEICTELHC